MNSDSEDLPPSLSPLSSFSFFIFFSLPLHPHPPSSLPLLFSLTITPAHSRSLPFPFPYPRFPSHRAPPSPPSDTHISHVLFNAENITSKFRSSFETRR